MGKGNTFDTAQTASGKDPSAPGWRARIITRSRPLNGPSTLRLRVGYVSMWSALGLTVKGEVRLDPIPGTVYRVAGTLGEDYSAAWVEDSSGQRVTDIVETFGKDRARAESAREAALALAQPDPSLSRQEAFLRQEEGECSDIIIARFGPPDAERKEGRVMRKSFEVLEFHGFGEAWMQFGSLQQVRPVAAPLQRTPEAVRQSLNNTGYDTLRHIAAGYARSGIVDPATLDVMAEFIWTHRLTDDRATTDAAAHLCHALGNSGNPRYRHLLEKVAQEATSSALQRHATQSLKQVSGETDAPFWPLD